MCHVSACLKDQRVLFERTMLLNQLDPTGEQMPLAPERATCLAAHK